jgi:hypothetical protein
VQSDEKLTIPEFVTKGARLSAFEDIKTRTLPRIQGLLPQLLYLADLRDDDGRYQHWGHARVHGETASQAALARVHAELYAQLLRTSIPDLVVGGSEESFREWQRQVERLLELKSKVVPVGSNSWSTLHFNSVVLALKMLSAGDTGSTRRVASQLPPPAQ